MDSSDSDPNGRRRGGTPALLPPWCRPVGLVLLVGGTALAVARFYFRYVPKALDVKVVAVAATYVDRKLLTIIPNNVTEELAGVLLVAGLFMMMLAADRRESPRLWQLRLRALVIASYAFAAALLFAILFTFGVAFVKALLCALAVLPTVFLLAFALLKRVQSPRG